MTRKLISIAALAAVVGLGACEKQLTVTNPNSGDTKRVLGTPNDAEALVATYYKRWHTGIYGSQGDIQGMANIFALMNYSSLANECQNSHAPFTGATNFNAPGNTCGGGQFRNYNFMGEVNRVASSMLTQMKDGLTLGTPARDARARAWSEFLRGLSLGYVSLMYDSAAVISEGMGSEDPGVLLGYRTVMDSAIAALDRSIAHATSGATGSDGFPIPQAWMPSPTIWSSAEFVKLIRSYRARFRANVARTPAERAAVDWAAVIADAQAGITADHQITTTTTGGITNGWRNTYESGLYHQMPPFIIGMGDVSGSYAAWIATPLGDRGSGGNGFFMVTPDLRFPQGATRAAQQADFAWESCQAASTPCKRYFRNRPNGNDQFAGLGWAFSNYDWVRYHSWNISGDGTARNGNTPFFVKSELDLLAAEGLYRQGNFAAAGAIVNVTRVRFGLPAITVFDATTAVPGGATNCVPKIPVGPAFNTIACGNLWEALKYEKRIETAFTAYTNWFLDERGWGDLPADVPLFWVTPYQDLQARGRATSEIYGAGIGAGNAPGSWAAKGTYGW